jgi:hypothetical protein
MKIKKVAVYFILTSLFIAIVLFVLGLIEGCPSKNHSERVKKFHDIINKAHPKNNNGGKIYETTK